MPHASPTQCRRAAARQLYPPRSNAASRDEADRPSALPAPSRAAGSGDLVGLDVGHPGSVGHRRRCGAKGWSAQERTVLPAPRVPENDGALAAATSAEGTPRARALRVTESRVSRRCFSSERAAATSSAAARIKSSSRTVLASRRGLHGLGSLPFGGLPGNMDSGNRKGPEGPGPRSGRGRRVFRSSGVRAVLEAAERLGPARGVGKPGWRRGGHFQGRAPVPLGPMGPVGMRPPSRAGRRCIAWTCAIPEIDGCRGVGLPLIQSQSSVRGRCKDLHTRCPGGPGRICPRVTARSIGPVTGGPVHVTEHSR